MVCRRSCFVSNKEHFHSIYLIIIDKLNVCRNVSEPVKGPATNNVAEIEAATRAVQVAKRCGIDKLQINTDSQFLIRCITEWLPKWQRNGWRLSDGGVVKNKVQLEDLHYNLKENINIKWVSKI